MGNNLALIYATHQPPPPPAPLPPPAPPAPPPAVTTEKPLGPAPAPQGAILLMGNKDGTMGKSRLLESSHGHSSAELIDHVLGSFCYAQVVFILILLFFQLVHGVQKIFLYISQT